MNRSIGQEGDVILKLFYFSSDGHSVQWSGTILAILEEGQQRNIAVIFFKIGPLVKKEMSFKSFSIFSSGGHSVQGAGNILAILVEGHQRNIAVK